MTGLQWEAPAAAPAPLPPTDLPQRGMRGRKVGESGRRGGSGAAGRRWGEFDEGMRDRAVARSAGGGHEGTGGPLVARQTLCEAPPLLIHNPAPQRPAASRGFSSFFRALAHSASAHFAFPLELSTIPHTPQIFKQNSLNPQ